jgi:hypothetical protein
VLLDFGRPANFLGLARTLLTCFRQSRLHRRIDLSRFSNHGFCAGSRTPSGLYTLLQRLLHGRE